MCIEERETVEQEQGIEKADADYLAVSAGEIPISSHEEELEKELATEVSDSDIVPLATVEIEEDDGEPHQIEAGPSNAELDEVSDDLVMMYLREAGQVPLLNVAEERA
ncbi:MAG: sigma-70 factor domain-containing protein, partial [Dehalococcoidia bacterium]